MKNIILFVILIFMFVSCSKTTPEAPFAHNSTLVGFVKFENALSDTVEAEVSLFQQSQGIKIASTQTDKNGKFVFEDISADTYQIQIKATGFEDKYLSNIALTSHHITTLDSIFIQRIRPIEYKKMIIDGEIDNGISPVYQNENDSNWSISNDFHNLYITRDDDSLYIAIDGGFDSSGNCVNIYIDTDGDGNTGISDFSRISGGDIGSHLNKNVSVAVDFGADIAFSEWALSSDINVVSLSNPSAVDENVIPNHTQVNASVIEFAIPFSAIYPSGSFPSEISIVAIIGGGDAVHFANDTIPQQSSDFDGIFKSVFSRNY